MKKILFLCTFFVVIFTLSGCGVHTIIKDSNIYFKQNLNPNWNLPRIQINI